MQPSNEPFRPGPPPFWPQQRAGPQRPKTPKILGILSIVFGSITAASSVWGVFSTGVATRFIRHLPQHIVEAYERLVAETNLATTIQSAAFLIMSIALIWIGAKQLKYRAVAVKASIWWGGIALLVLVGAVFQHMFIHGPALERYNDAIAGDTLPGLGQMSAMMGYVGLLAYVPYPIILIVTFRKQAIVDVMKE
jgi:hypothetical protein